MEEIVVHPPSSTQELVAELGRVGARSVRFWNSFGPEEFYRPIGDAWSPCDNVRHLTRSVTLVAQALRVPRLVLSALFGRSGRPPRGHEAVEAAYQKVLAEGGKASGRFVPRTLAPPSESTAARRKSLRTSRRRTRLSSLSCCRGPRPRSTATSCRIRSSAASVGRRVEGNGGFNQPWSWSLDPSTVGFAEAAVEVCDGCPSHIEAELEYWLHSVRFLLPVADRSGPA